VTTRHPQHVRSLVTVVGYAHPRTTLRLNLELWSSLCARDSEDVGKFLTSLSFSERYLAALPPTAVEQIIQQFGAPPTAGTAAQIALNLAVDVRDDLSAVRVPTLVVAATGDRFVAPEHSAELVDGITNARLVETTGGHASIFEDPQQTQDALLDFLASEQTFK
jgi:pimeloyl-ACP methyl ester carboxylesterase